MSSPADEASNSTSDRQSADPGPAQGGALEECLACAEAFDRTAGPSAVSQEWLRAESESLLHWAEDRGRMLSAAQLETVIEEFSLPDEAEEHFKRLLAARAHLGLPPQSDFCAGPGQDAWSAWCDFGGLRLDAAYQKFIEVPEGYQEDFMWMFPAAFEYYYPVVDRYLRTACVSEHAYRYNNGCQAWILGCCLESQFHWADGSRPPDYVVSEIRDLAAFVRQNLHRYSADQSEQQRIDACWAVLHETLSAT